MEKANPNTDGSPRKTRTSEQLTPQITVKNGKLVIGGKSFPLSDHRVYASFDVVSALSTDRLPKGVAFAITQSFNSDSGICEDLDLLREKNVVVTFSINIDRKKPCNGIPGGTWGHLIAAVAETEPGCIENVFFAVKELSLHMKMQFDGGTVAEIIDAVVAKLAKIAERARGIGQMLVSEDGR